MKRIWLYSLIMLLSAPVVGQNINAEWRRLNINSNRLQGKLTGSVFYLNSISNNNYFLQKDWFPGTIQLEDGDLFENQWVRYHARQDELVVFNETIGNLILADKNKVKSFTVNSDDGPEHFVKLYFDGFNPGTRYFEELFAGNRSLLAFYYIQERKSDVYADKNGKLKDTFYLLDTKYYMYSEETGFIRLHNSRRSFYRIFPEHKKQMRRLFRKNKLYTLDKQGLIRTFELLQEAGILK